MDSGIAGIIVLVIFAILVKLINDKIASLKEDFKQFPYEKQGRLLTPAERSFFGVLEQAVGESYRIFVKIRLGDLFRVKAGMDPKDKLRAFNKISAKHIDFVICEPDSVEVLAAIELDDKSHDRPKRKIRDEFVNQVFEGSGVPLGRVPAKKSYSLVDVYGVLSQILDTGPEVDLEEVEEDFVFGDEHKCRLNRRNFSTRLNLNLFAHRAEIRWRKSRLQKMRVLNGFALCRQYALSVCLLRMLSEVFWVYVGFIAISYTSWHYYAFST